jgi:S-DNA-T family DNA segregation ATPase FtsK/SpoIIIE
VKLKITLQRPGGNSSVDLIATADARATVGDIAQFLESSDLAPKESRPLTDPPGKTLAVVSSDTRALDPRLPIGESGLKSGATVTIVSDGARYQDPEAVGAAVVQVTDGPDTGKEFRLSRGSTLIGRDPTCDLTLNDPLVSRQHARLNVTDDVEIADLGSANGVVAGGATIARTNLRVGDKVVLGDSELTLIVAPTPRGTDVDDQSTVRWIRSPRLEPQYSGDQFVVPEPPEPPQRSRFPVVPMIAPIAIGALLYLITKSATSLIFVALSPLMLLGNAVESRLAGKSHYKRATATFRTKLADLVSTAETAAALEVAARCQENPSVTECLRAATGEGTLLWTRRPDDSGFAELRLGLGRQSSRSTIELPDFRRGTPELHQEIQQHVQRFSHVDGVPITARLRDTGALGIAGPRQTLLDVARAVVCQAVVLHSPAELVISGFASSNTSADWDWLKWLPHTSSPHSPLECRQLASNSSDAVKLVSELEDLVDRRAAPDADPSSSLPAIIVLIESDAPVEYSRLVELAECGWRNGVYVVWLAPSAALLPAACRTFFDARDAQQPAGSVGYVHTGERVDPVFPETLSAGDAARLARSLAPVVDIGARVDDDSDLPRSVSLLGLPGSQLSPTAQSVLERWTESRSIITGPCAPAQPPRHSGSLRAVIGQAAGEPHAVDLRSDGPHALVGGTTGSGKSELLQTWILAMAAAHSPQRLTFLLVDYKGGSAFRDCVDLPHTVGLVTDLSQHLVRRALTSLAAELRYREHLLSAHDAKDLVTLEKQGIVEAPPSLVIVVDEFAALVQEVPEFVDGVVNVAQRGRSLGLHLILATQQPAGVIKDKLRANTNLRLALRMADEHDSTDVLGSPQAAFFDPALPGRSVSKTGPGRLVPFQAGYVGGWTKEEPPPPEILVEELVFGTGRIWEAKAETAVVTDPGPTDIQRLVAAVRRASSTAEIAAPRRPWLNELDTVYDLSDQTAVPSRRRDDELVFGIQDDPENQSQPTVAFRPDRDGNLAVYGTGGAGKSTLLRSIAIAASFTVRGGPCHVYGIDFGARGLSLLEELPHVGSIISGNDDERISRLLHWLRTVIDERAERYSSVNAGSVSDYRSLASRPDEPRLILLIDGLPAFRAAYDVGERGRLFDLFIGICSDGRPVGVHVVLSADRPAAVPTSLGSTLQRRVVLRMADEADYAYAGLPTDVLKPASPAGRGLLDDIELQVGILGASPEPLAQARAVRRLATAMRRAGVAQAPQIQRLPEVVGLADLPTEFGGAPVLGMSAATLGPLPFVAEGCFIVTGPPGSGRTIALSTIIDAIRRHRPGTPLYRLSAVRASWDEAVPWQANIVGVDAVAAAATEVTALINRPDTPASTIVLEGLPDFLNTPADLLLQSLVKEAARAGHFVVCEGEISAFGSMYPLLSLVRNARTGLSLQPDQMDGSVFKTDFPRARRADFPVGRGFYVRRSTTTTVQVALPSYMKEVPGMGSPPHSPPLVSSLS